MNLQLCLLLNALLSTDQPRVVVIADATTHEPVARASLYTKENGRFRSVISDAEGRAAIGFEFQRLTVSHLNYDKLTIRSLSDTIFLKPRYRSTAEVVVTNEEPAWIRQKLKEVVRQKETHYFTQPAVMHFDYHTQSMGTNNLYRYHLGGQLRMKSADSRAYAFRQEVSDIVAVDTTFLTDIANLRRILYEDFMAELDNGFIRAHRWGENPEFKGRSDDEIELFYRSTSRSDDRGRVVIDTARCVILGATRFSGTKTNVHERMSPMLYAMARMISGYRIDVWTREYRVRYAERPDGSFYPQEVRYKTYLTGRENEVDKRQQEFSDQTGGGFPNMEATLTLTPLSTTLGEDIVANAGETSSSDLESSQSERVGAPWEDLPGSWYIRLSSDAAQRRDVYLSNLPATFTIFEE